MVCSLQFFCERCGIWWKVHGVNIKAIRAPRVLFPWIVEEVVKEVEKTVKTTIKLADRLWRDVKVYAANR